MKESVAASLETAGKRKRSWCYNHYDIQYREWGISKMWEDFAWVKIQEMDFCFTPATILVFSPSYNVQMEDAIDFEVTHQGKVSTVASPLV